MLARGDDICLNRTGLEPAVYPEGWLSPIKLPDRCHVTRTDLRAPEAIQTCGHGSDANPLKGLGRLHAVLVVRHVLLLSWLVLSVAFTPPL